MAFAIFVIARGCCGQYSTGNFEPDQNIISTITLPHGAKTILSRAKRGGGGGGFIPFRPLFIYRQQQKKKQEKWKEIEARKKVEQDHLLQYQQYQGAIHAPIELPSYHPTSRYSSIYPSTDYSSYYGRNNFEKYPTYYSDAFSYYQDD